MFEIRRLEGGGAETGDDYAYNLQDSSKSSYSAAGGSRTEIETRFNTDTCLYEHVHEAFFPQCHHESGNLDHHHRVVSPSKHVLPVGNENQLRRCVELCN